MIHRRKTVTAISVLLTSALAAGCSTAVSSRTGTLSPSSQPHKTIHTNKEGIPIAPYSHGSVQTLIVAYVNWDKPTTSFGYTGKMSEQVPEPARHNVVGARTGVPARILPDD